MNIVNVMSKKYLPKMITLYLGLQNWRGVLYFKGEEYHALIEGVAFNQYSLKKT